MLQLLDVSVTIPGTDEPTAVRGLFTGEGLTWLTVNLGANFIEFPPLVTVVTILLAVTVAERTGLLGAMIRVSLGSAPRWLLPYAVGLVGVTASVMADAAFIVVPPLAAMVFKAAGRHPIAGLVGGFASVGAGYSTSTLVTSLDALFAGITNAVTEGLPDPGATVTPISNYWFNLASSFVLAPSPAASSTASSSPAWSARVPRSRWCEATDESLGAVDSDDDEVASALRENPTDLSPELEAPERQALDEPGSCSSALIALILVAVLPPGSPWRNEEGNFLPESALLDSTVFIVFVLFLVPGIVYGFRAGTLKNPPTCRR